MSQIRIPSNRPLKNLRKEWYKECKFKYIFFWFITFPIYVQNIAYWLEGIEGNTDWKNNLCCLFWKTNQCTQISCKEIHVLKKDKKTKQNKTLCPHPKLSCFLLLIFFNHKCTQPAPKCHSGKQKQICSTAPRIENERKYEQYNIFLTNRLYRIVTDEV